MTTATKPRHSHRSEVHRKLHLSSPFLTGPDVRALQEQLNHQCKHYGFPWRCTKVDGDYGRRTARTAKFVAWLIGLDGPIVETIGGNAGHLGTQVQELLRDPSKRSAMDRKREDDRKSKRERLRKAHDDGTKAAVDWALKRVGTRESPPESNTGTQIDIWTGYFGLHAVPWCGCFAGYAVKKHGAVCGTWFPYAGSIRQDAIAGRNNLHDINPTDAEPGDIVTFFSGGDDHVALIREKSRNGMVFTVEGNTSSATRDSDGGIVEVKTRSFSEVTCVARIEEWA